MTKLNLFLVDLKEAKIFSETSATLDEMVTLNHAEAVKDHGLMWCLRDAEVLDGFSVATRAERETKQVN